MHGVCVGISQSRNAELREEVRWHEQQRLRSDFDAAPPPRAALNPKPGNGSAAPAAARAASPQYAFSDAPVGLGYGGGGSHGGAGAPGALRQGGAAANGAWSSHSGAGEGSYWQEGGSGGDCYASEEAQWQERASHGPGCAPDQQGVLQGGWQPLQPDGAEAGADGQGFRTLDGVTEGLSKRGHADGGAGAQVYELEAQDLEAHEGFGQGLSHEGFSQGLGERSSSSGAVDAVVEQLQAARAARRDWAGPGAAAEPPHVGSRTGAPGATDLAGSYEAAGAPHGGAGLTSGGTDWDAGHQGSDGHPGGEEPPQGYGSGEPQEEGYPDHSEPANPDSGPAAEGAWQGAWGAQGIDSGLRNPQGSALAQAPPPPPIPRFDRRSTATGANGAAVGTSDPDQAAGFDANPGQGFAEAVEAALRESTALQARSSFTLHTSRPQGSTYC